MGNWSKLKADEKVRVIKFARLNGVSDIKTIRDTYNLYSNGGLEEILNKVNSSNANFVQRLKDPNRKNIPDWESPTDRISTHKLSVGTDENGNHYIFPEVQEINGELIDFTRPPYHRFAGEISAEMRGDTVRVSSLEDAIKFTETYKQYYPFNNGGNLSHKKSGKDLGESLNLNYPNLLPEVEVYPNMLPEVEVKPSVLYRLTHFQDNYNPGLYTDILPYLPKLIQGPVRKTTDYIGRLLKATGNIMPQTNWFFDLADGIVQQSNLNTTPILSNAGNAYVGLGKLTNLPILKGVGKVIGLPDLIDDSVEFYNALLNRPKEKKVSDWVLLQAVDAIEKRIHTKSTGGPLYPFSFEKNPFFKTPIVRYDEGGHLYGFGDWLKNIFKPNNDKQENTNNQNNLNYTSKVKNAEEIIWQNLPDTIILNNGINSGNVFDVARYAISGEKLDVPDTRFAWDLFSRDGFDNVYKVDKENKLFISLDPILYEKSVKPKLDYIGGSTEDARAKTAYMINAYPVIQGIANKYSISPNLLFERFAHEGVLDDFAREYNNEYNAEKQRLVKKDPSIFWNTNYSAYNNMGLDTVLKHYMNGDLKILDDSVNTFFEELIKTNNYTKTLNEKGTESLDFEATPENMIHLQAAYFKFLKDKYQKDVEKGNYGNIDINTFLNAAYNLGQYHKDLKSTKWVTDNYSVKNWYNN